MVNKCLGAAVLLMLIMGMTGCASQRVRMPAVSPIPTHDHHLGKFVWFDLYTDDLETATRFYELLFGWSFEATNLANSNVKTILSKGVPIANAIYSRRLDQNIKESRWLGYISVDDVDRVAAFVEASDGSVYLPPETIPDRGRMAILIDPDKAIFAVIRSAQGDPVDMGIIENGWMGSELWTTDLEASVVFYSRIAGYHTREVDLEAGRTYTFLETDDRSRAGIVQIPWEHIKPDWLPYVAVTNVFALTERARSLGGQILVEPDTRVRHGRVAIIADPSGAVFAVQQVAATHNGEDE